MMTSPSPPSLDQCSEERTARNHGPQPVPPPAVAAQSPFHEVLIGDLAAWLPAPLAQRLAATTSLEELHQLLGAGILYRWIADDPCLARLYLQALDGDPKRAALALTRALSARADPPPADPLWRRCDRAGLLLQLVTVSAVLLCRSILFTLLAWYGVLPARFGLLDVLHGVLGLDLLSRHAPAGNLAWTIAGYGAVFWCALEAGLLPRPLETLRHLPARLAHLPPPLSWRTDAFYVAWFGQAGMLALCLGIHFGAHLAPAATGATWAATVSLELVLVASIGILALGARALLTLGSTSG
jgi:hypothetical protein